VGFCSFRKYPIILIRLHAAAVGGKPVKGEMSRGYGATGVIGPIETIKRSKIFNPSLMLQFM
jgi:hypothetical protein